MRDDVCIVLNEHEPQKAEMAEALTRELNERGLSCTRLEPTEKLVEIIKERSPRILVLDYLIGDVATALDILPELRGADSEKGTGIILWTDEPSTSVAVAAMKLGAADYIPCGVIDDLPKVLDAIETEIANHRPAGGRKPAPTARSSGEPIAQSELFTTALKAAASAAACRERVVVLLGPCGSGRSTVGRYLHAKRPRGGQLLEIDCDVWLGEAADICGAQPGSSKIPLLSFLTTLLLDHVEFDPGEILNLLHESRRSIWSGDSEESPILIAATSCSETARAWSRLLEARLIDVHGLADRSADFWPLVQHFYKESKALVGTASCELSAPLVQAMASLNWPGNVKQLRAVIHEVVAGNIGSAKNNKELPGVELSEEERRVLDAVCDAKERWERYALVEPIVPAPMAARYALDSAGGNLRIAAARLGTGVQQVRGALQLARREERHNGGGARS